MNALWSGISFREPLWLLLALQPFVLMLLLRLLRLRRQVAYCEAALRPWAMSQTQTRQLAPYLRLIVFCIAWLLLAIASAGPRLPQTVADNQSSAARELMVLVDNSPSMAARDVLPNRLERSKLELLDLIKRMQATRMGMIVFGAQPHLLSPMTTDKQVLRHYIGTLQHNQLPSAGSRLDRALRLAQQQFAANNRTPRALLLLSDGEFHLDAAQRQSLHAHVQQLAGQGIRLYVLGIGTAYGAPVLAADQGWLSYQGQTVTTRLDASELQSLAQLGQGRYSELADGNEDWQNLYDDGIGQLHTVEQNQATAFIVWRELYHWFLLPGMVLFLLALWQPHKLNAAPMLLLPLLLTLPLTTAQDVQAAEADYPSAYRLLVKQDYPQARRQFARLAGYTARLGEGVAAYRLQDYKAAAQQFTQALFDAMNDAQRGQALFNLGNSQYQLQDYQSAAQTYADVLNYLPDHKGARTNRDYALALQAKDSIDNSTHRRAGTGIKTGRVKAGTDVGEGRLTLGEESDAAPAPIGDTDITPAKQPTTLLQQARTASGKVDTQGDSAWDYRIHSLEQLQQENPRIVSEPGTFWQRLYEQEEGFMAPQQQAQQLPGVQPW